VWFVTVFHLIHWFPAFLVPFRDAPESALLLPGIRHFQLRFAEQIRRERIHSSLYDFFV
jgi:hypothetical protein